MRTPTRFGAKDAAYRAELLTVSHQLACGAAPFHRGVDIVIETDTDSRNTLVPVLDPTGIELAAWAQWAQHLAHFEPEHGSLARDAELIELGAILLATRLHDQVPPSRTMHARNHPNAPSVPTELAVGLFNELLTNDAAICRAAHLAQTDTDTAYQTLIDARREVVGPHLSIVRGDG